MKVRYLLIGVAVLFVVSVLTTSSHAEVGIDACIGMWLFDEGNGNVAKDSSENGNDGEIKGDPDWVDGEFGKALSLDGVGDYVDLPELPEQTDQPLSVAARIKWAGSTATTRGVWGYTNVATINCHFEIQAAGMRTRLGNINKTGMDNPPADQWAFVCFTYDGDTSRYYLNGVETGSVSGGTGTIFGAESVLGNMVGVSDAGRFFDGLIDEVALFSVALTEDDIGNIMNDGLGKVLGLTAVDLSGKLATTWADIKAR